MRTVSVQYDVAIVFWIWVQVRIRIRVWQCKWAIRVTAQTALAVWQNIICRPPPHRQNSGTRNAKQPLLPITLYEPQINMPINVINIILHTVFRTFVNYLSTVGVAFTQCKYGSNEGKTIIHSSKMHTARLLLYGEVFLTETSRTETPQTETSLDRDPLDRDPPG